MFKDGEWKYVILYILYVVGLILIAPWLFHWLELYCNWVFGL